MARFRLVAVSLVLLAGPTSSETPRFTPLAEDGLHDPSLPAVGLLQEPSEGLGALPPDTAGNRVNWSEAIRGGYIRPRATLLEQGSLPSRDTVILMPRTGDAPVVRFPHREHTDWLDCSNCHPHPFAEDVGKTPMTMLDILNGLYCGQCHGAVAFPLTECSRCHSVPWDEYQKTR